MTRRGPTIPVYLETGTKRIFAGAVDWPGWCRSGRNESAALQALFDCAPRYARVLRGTGLGFISPADPSSLKLVERLKGNTTTDFGAPDASPKVDSQRVTARDLQRLSDLLRACWRYLDATARKARGKSLRKGPRGGGRDLQSIVRHVNESEGGYLSALGGKLGDPGVRKDPRLMRRVILEGLAASARGDIPARGPRGGLRWTPRYFVRRVTWHILDHAWEIEDRLE
jgi:hypothetical protein